MCVWIPQFVLRLLAVSQHCFVAPSCIQNAELGLFARQSIPPSTHITNFVGLIFSVGSLDTLDSFVQQEFGACKALSTETRNKRRYEYMKQFILREQRRRFGYPSFTYVMKLSHFKYVDVRFSYAASLGKYANLAKGKWKPGLQRTGCTSQRLHRGKRSAPTVNSQITYPSGNAPVLRSLNTSVVPAGHEILVATYGAGYVFE